MHKVTELRSHGFVALVALGPLEPLQPLDLLLRAFGLLGDL
jgi:hypothetical protein